MTDHEWRSDEPGAGPPGDDGAVAETLAVSTMTLATVGPSGDPHATPVFFATDADLRFVFFSDPDSLHVRHALDHPGSSAAIYPAVVDWTEIRGLQVDGAISQLAPGAGWDRAWAVYTRKFPFVGGLREIVDQNWLLVLVPEWIRVVDNRRGFGFKREWRRGRAG